MVRRCLFVSQHCGWSVMLTTSCSLFGCHVPRNDSAIGFDDLTSALQNEVKELQKRMAIELQPLALESTLTMQKLLEAADHTDRLKLVRHFVASEMKRLTTKKTLQGVFSEKKDGEEKTSMKEDAVDTQKKLEELNRSVENSPGNQPSTSLFTDEPDAFQ
jgi:hypothetical protein